MYEVYGISRESIIIWKVKVGASYQDTIIHTSVLSISTLSRRIEGTGVSLPRDDRTRVGETRRGLDDDRPAVLL